MKNNNGTNGKAGGIVEHIVATRKEQYADTAARVGALIAGQQAESAASGLLQTRIHESTPQENRSSLTSQRVREAKEQHDAAGGLVQQRVQEAQELDRSLVRPPVKPRR